VGAQREALATRPAHGPWSRSSFTDAEAAPKATPQDAQADALVAEPRAQLADMRAQRDAWQRVAERLALGAPKPEPPKPMTWWRWLHTTG
jgi:hypothetical protein